MAPSSSSALQSANGSLTRTASKFRLRNSSRATANLVTGTISMVSASSGFKKTLSEGA